MSDARARAFAVLLHVLALLFVVGAGLMGASPLFAGTGRSETAASRWMFTLDAHVLRPLFIGALLPRRWWFGPLCTRGAARIGALYLPDLVGPGLVGVPVGAIGAPPPCLVWAWCDGLLGPRARG